MIYWRIFFFALLVFAGDKSPKSEWKAVGVLPLRGHPKKNACVQLKVGESALINFNRSDSPTGVNALYLLERSELNSYLARIHLKFVPGEGYDLLFQANELDEFFQLKVQRCLDAAAPFLRDLSGEGTLKIQLTKAREIPEETIEIKGTGHRSSQVAFGSRINCPAVLHEILHHLGLNDEYSEALPVETSYAVEFRNKKTGAKKFEDVATKIKFNCRPDAPEDSIMNDHWQSGAMAWPQQEKKLPFCRCEPAADCKKIAKLSHHQDCPPGSKRIEAAYKVWAGDSLVLEEATDSFPLLDTDPKLVLADIEWMGAKRSLLYPAHFRVITSPGCFAENRVYYECIANTDRFSGPIPPELQKLGITKMEENGCFNMPPECSKNSVEWITGKKAGTSPLMK